jgi:translation initiation factor IF-3
VSRCGTRFSAWTETNDIAKEYRVNDRIRVPEVRVVDEDGGQLGVMSARDALQLARDHDLDLVEVAPNSVPPVCRLLDYGKFRYLQSTKEKEMRKTQKTNSLREVRFRPKIGLHDIQAKERLVHRLLSAGNKVKVSVMFRGREIDHPEIAVKLLKQVNDVLEDEAKLEQPPKLEGRFMSIILAPAKVAAPVAKAPDDEEDDLGLGL